MGTVPPSAGGTAPRSYFRGEDNPAGHRAFSQGPTVYLRWMLLKAIWHLCLRVSQMSVQQNGWSHQHVSGSQCVHYLGALSQTVCLLQVADEALTAPPPPERGERLCHPAQRPPVLPELRKGSERGALGLSQSAGKRLGRARLWSTPPSRCAPSDAPGRDPQPSSPRVRLRAAQGGPSRRQVAMGKERVGNGFLHSPSSPTKEMQTDQEGGVTSHLALFIQMPLHSGELILKKMSESQCTELLSLDFPSSVDWSKSSLQGCPHPDAWSEEMMVPREAGSQAGPEVQPWPPAARPSRGLICLLTSVLRSEQCVGKPPHGMLAAEMSECNSQNHLPFPLSS